MKHFLLLFLLSFLWIQVAAQAAHPHHHEAGKGDTLPPYLANPYLPTFSIQQADSSWFSRSEIAGKKPVLLVYFSPDCGHCMLETEELIARMSKLQKVQIVMVTSKPLDELQNFANHYKLNRFANIRIGTDPQRRITRFYQVKTTPFSAVYNKKGKLLKVYDDGIDWDELLVLLD